MKRLLIALALCIAAALALAGYSYREAMRDPVVREASLSLPGWPEGAAPVKVVLISDLHIGSVAMGAERLTRIVSQINALKPDLVVIAGDFISGHAANSAARIGEPMVAPLSGLKPPLGVVAALGNHDHWTGGAATRALLQRAGVTVVDNDAVQRGPLAIGVVGDEPTRNDDIPAALAAMAKLPGGRLMLSHSPDIFPDLPADTVLLAGHTHCGQLVLPLFGPLAEVSDFGARYRCGLVRERKGVVVVTAGLGTSVIPLRLGAPPDLWLLTLGK
ncbi:MAG: metallophosphoesterase [Sphingomonadales bacterium]|nr:MAG: metallophosphoesterase [Sphingomonadales bacterium]